MRALALAVVLAASEAAAVNFCGNTQHVDTCGRPVNIYPCCPNGSNCTWWAWEMTCRNWHIGLVNWGNANTWASHARVDPRFVLTGPQAGTIATSTLGNYGHVAWVIGTTGGTVTVTEQNCCSSCSRNVRTITYGTGKFNSGFVQRRGAQCACSPGQVQRQACGSCGSQTRGCDGCNWGGWGACGGADPGGGSVSCDNGGKGVCLDARQRCVGGNLSCESLVKASAEVCDGLDNDCNDLVDDGHPPLGAQRPPFAATLLDASYPRTMKLGEKATMWADFRNDGTQTWTRDNLWLSAFDDTRLSAPSWPAFNVAAVLEGPVAPGEVARFSFDVLASFDTTGELNETFTLKQPDGPAVACPQGEVTAVIRVLHDDATPVTEEETAPVPEETDQRYVFRERGCAVMPGLPLAALLVLVLRRRGRQGGDDAGR
ncbi:MAG: CHAP domain-containing protein [Archangiaceae bacterium]|nr:CHAP domain-containing protein [Archangiaceae bacterium]